MKTLKIIIPVVLFADFCLAGCRQKIQEASSPEVLQAEHLEIDSVQKIVARTRQSYKLMNDDTLLKKLADQSKRKKEPFNSLAYRELASRKTVKPDNLIAQIHQLNNGDALLPLLLLRTLNDKAYTVVPIEIKVNILTDALQQSKTFNVWGLPGPYPEDASKALIACDTSAIPALKRLLSETRPAPLYGSKESMVYQRYKLRLCDYALYFIEEIRGNKNFVMPLTIPGREALISKM
jgi:hypothetical protein